MPIGFVPEPGMVLLCDYDTGFRPPEMVKVRHCVIISPKMQNKQGLCVVVPVSHKRPNPMLAYHHYFAPNVYPFFTPDRPHWVKGDLLSHVAFDRLDRVLVYGEWCSPKVSDADLMAIRHCTLSAIGLAELKPKQNQNVICLDKKSVVG